MRKITTILILVVCAMFFSTLSANSYKSIVINKADNTNIMILIESTMTSNITDGNLVITSSKGTVTLPVADVKNWTFSTDDNSDTLFTSLKNNNSDANCIQLRDRILINNLPSDSQVTLFTANGKILRSTSVSDSYELSFSELPNGIYLLKYNYQTVKIIVTK